MVGGRSYNQSQFNRAVSARRQPGSVAKPFVYLAAFERARTDGRSNLTPATLVDDEPTTFLDRDQAWTPGNYADEYDGRISFRHALAHSRNVATIKAAEMTGYDRVAALWRKLGTSTVPKAYPSVALGVFEATPLEIAEAYTMFPNGGTTRPLRTVGQLKVDGQELAPPPSGQAHPVAHSATTYLVTSMMRSVMTEGTGASARALGFVLDAAGKSGTTNDLRDAWFVGFTPELLTVVWVGFDDNRPLGLSGTQAALPIWTSFMSRALGGHPNIPFEMPPDVMLVDIDPDTGQLAGPACPRVLSEAFLAGTAPTERCTLHQY
jgi:penicillin-binding protein 1B